MMIENIESEVKMKKKLTIKILRKEAKLFAEEISKSIIRKIEL